jgi:hypothetical protein
VTDSAALFDFGSIVWLQIACDWLQPLNLPPQSASAPLGLKTAALVCIDIKERIVLGLL